MSNHLTSVLRLLQSAGQSYLESISLWKTGKRISEHSKLSLIRTRGQKHSSNSMSSKETEREEMKEETHDVEDMEQDELYEEDSEDEGS